MRYRIVLVAIVALVGLLGLSPLGAMLAAQQAQGAICQQNDQAPDLMLGNFKAMDRSTPIVP